ncbi:hypothetical protein BpHYR1_046966 [Brachionus plicatilis]|uniref:MARVEL domain-containing protein n=1 Tax=Brachionus plicatilis TaxID=10195 RepID=A0A3M7SDC4_BRAPC|nr:hypothetical protein BpHYR1_046966 [Brachionus plicatilis]
MIVQSYFKSLKGFLRVFLLLLLLAMIVSSAVALKTNFSNLKDLEPTRSALLAFSIIGFLENLFIYLLNTFNGMNTKPLSEYPILLISTIIEVLISIAILGASIAAAIAESDFEKIENFTQYRGAYGAAAGFGFASFIIYFVIIIFAYIDLSKTNSFESVNTNVQGPVAVQETALRTKIILVNFCFLFFSNSFFFLTSPLKDSNHDQIEQGEQKANNSNQIQY